MKWIKDEENDYIAYSQGIYYKVNNAVLWRKGTNKIILRNTWTDKEKTIWEDDIFKTNKKEVEKALKTAIKMIEAGVIKTI